MRYVVGVDVGTGSVRAGLFDLTGKRRATASRPIQLWKPHPEWAEQSSDDIWNAVGECVRDIVADAGIAPETVVGLGFDATCSLVVLDEADKPVTVSDDGDDTRNVIVWMDHRALGETEEINAGGWDVLRYVGGALSPEMQTPKLKWLQTHLPDSWAKAAKFLDLADFLTYAATGNDARSLCTTVCKWTYLGHENRWDNTYFAGIGLEDALPKIGSHVRALGEPAGKLTADTARHLGLTTRCTVGIGAIDAHAGGLGLLGAAGNLEESLALIGGTSSCHMAVSREPKFISGVWGPYFGAMVPDFWLTEGGQSATGALIDWTLENHAASPALFAEAESSNRTVYALINDELEELAANVAHPALLTRDLHVFDGHLGNRSPLADPRARGLIDGLTLDSSRASLALLYLAAVQSVAYGTRAILETLTASGSEIRQIHAVGGGTKNPVWLREHADITGLPLHLPEEPEAVLLGAALLGAVAARAFDSIPTAMRAMCRSVSVIHPNPAVKHFHDAKFEIYKELYVQQKERREKMRTFA